MEKEQIQINPILLTNIKNYTNDFMELSEIQIEIIKNVLVNKDILIVSRAGTGKTFSIIVSVLNNLEMYEGRQIIILEPNIGHLEQVFNMVSELSKDLSVNVIKSYGSVPIGDSITEIKNIINTTQFIVISPSRLSTLIKVEPSLFPNLSKLIIDETDELIDKFRTDFREIISIVGKGCQICAITPTICKEYFDIIVNHILVDPIIKKYY
jgi:ATP-dependent RNA helicase DeaD